MKKFLILFALTMTLSANAQIVKTVVTKPENNVVASARQGTIQVNLEEGQYYLTIPSYTSYEGAGRLSIGMTEEEAGHTLQDLLDMSKSMNLQSMVEIKDGDKDVYVDKWASGGLRFHFEGISGNCNISKTELVRLIKLLDK